MQVLRCQFVVIYHLHMFHVMRELTHWAYLGIFSIATWLALYVGDLARAKDKLPREASKQRALSHDIYAGTYTDWLARRRLRGCLLETETTIQIRLPHRRRTLVACTSQVTLVSRFWNVQLSSPGWYVVQTVFCWHLTLSHISNNGVMWKGSDIRLLLVHSTRITKLRYATLIHTCKYRYLAT